MTKDKKPKKTGENKRDEKGRYLEGVSGNPEGRPKGAGISITTEIKRKLNEVNPKHKATYLQLFIQRIMKKAIEDGDTRIIKEIWNYIDGMPKQSLDVTKKSEIMSDEEYKKIDKILSQNADKSTENK